MDKKRQSRKWIPNEIGRIRRKIRLEVVEEELCRMTCHMDRKE